MDPSSIGIDDERSRPANTEQAVELFLARRRAGERTDPAAFAAEHPEHEPELSAALAALLAFERVTAPDPPLDAALPDRISGFRVVREIGHGGMGVVLEAIEERLNRRVALKVLQPELVASPYARSRFRREAELAARIDHSGIAMVYGAGMEDERPWIAMRFVDGDTLARRITEARENGAPCVRLSSARTSERDAALLIASLIARVARALHAAHELGVVHRDIKPSNVIVQPDGSPVLLDFGLAIAEEPDGRSLTRTGEAPGTPAYLAPETINGEIVRPDVQSDVYALGVTLYECLTLRRPFEAPTRVALYRSILSDAAPDPRALNRAVSRDLAVVVAAAMERERGRRYRTALALAEDLEACAHGRPIAARAVPWHGRLVRWIRREPRQAALAGLLGASAIGLTLFGGVFWANRSVVRAAEMHAREVEREHALSRGFLALQSDFDGAEAAFGRALELDRSSLEALAGRVLVRLRYGKAHEARTLLDSAPSTLGFDALRASWANTRIDQDRVALTTPNTSALDFFLIGVALELEADRQNLSTRAAVSARAAAMLNEAVVCAPTPRSFMHVERATAAAEAGDESMARSASRALLALWPDSYDEVFAAGRALGEVDPRAARPIFERASRIDSREPGALQALGIVNMNLGDLEEAERCCWLALDRGRDVEMYNVLGAVCMMRGCPDDGLRTFADAIVANSKSERSWLNFGLALVDTGKPREAVPVLEHVLDLDPTNAQAHTNLGLALSRAEDPEGARRHLEQALALAPDAASAYARLARVLATLGNQRDALDVVAAGLALKPKDAGLLQLREDLGARH
jgi:tetratricopeptide (TPR) repeat protein/tRNA A-37 threonylcarbamoyl transferase component Bud32